MATKAGRRRPVPDRLIALDHHLLPSVAWLLQLLLALRTPLSLIECGSRRKLKAMKVLSTAGALLLAATFPLTPLAQEESPTPTEKLTLRATEPEANEDPIVSVPSERSSTKYPRPGAPLNTATPAPSVRDTPVASPSPTAAKSASAAKAPASVKAPNAAAKSPTRAKTAATSATPASSATLPKNPEAAVKEMENRWLAASRTHDIEVVRGLVADNYIGVTATGRFVNKTGLLADLKKDNNTYDSATNTRMDVRAHGDAAVVVGLTRQAGKDAAGREFVYNYRWTDTWVLRNGQWRCVASQSIQVPR